MVKCQLKDGLRGFKEMLARRGFNTIQAFSDFSGLSYHTLQQVCSGKRTPSPRIAFEIAAALGMTFDDLFIFDHRRGSVYVGGETEA